MREDMKRAWMHRHALEVIIAEADRSHPLETGGVLLGYWAVSSREVVIMQVIGPGPGAVHKAHGFIPDYAYQEQRIAEHYQASASRHTYLGDWHTHPDTPKTRLSWRDRQTLRRIASCKEARSPTPLMAIFAGAPGNWTTTIWKACLRRYGNLLLGPKAIALSVQIW